MFFIHVIDIYTIAVKNMMHSSSFVQYVRITQVSDLNPSINSIILCNIVLFIYM